MKTKSMKFAKYALDMANHYRERIHEVGSENTQALKEDNIPSALASTRELIQLRRLMRLIKDDVAQYERLADHDLWVDLALVSIEREKNEIVEAVADGRILLDEPLRMDLVVSIKRWTLWGDAVPEIRAALTEGLMGLKI